MGLAPGAGQLRKQGFAAAIGSLLMLVAVACAWVLDGWYPDLYYRSVQEDEALEWATFWAFVLAAVAFVVTALRQGKATDVFPWFSVGVALFCVFVAAEEISWGQRVVGYRPPDYFLEKNFQQELNLHNLASSGLRKLALKVVILGYGVMLPLLALIPLVRRTLHGFGVAAAPWQLVPGFAATYILYEIYPLQFSGEWVEVMLGLGFLFAGVLQSGEYAPQKPVSGGKRVTILAVMFVWLATIAAGIASATLSREFVARSPERLQAARFELEALQRDFESGRVRMRCGLHKRLHSFRSEYGEDYLLEGDFARLTRQGLPDARARFLLDPWNSPYWIRDRCRSGRRVTFVYSFGPDRQRQSSRWEILGDDVGVYLDSSK